MNIWTVIREIINKQKKQKMQIEELQTEIKKLSENIEVLASALNNILEEK